VGLVGHEDGLRGQSDGDQQGQLDCRAELIQWTLQYWFSLPILVMYSYFAGRQLYST